MKKSFPAIALILTIFLGELYRVWHTPEVRLRKWFLLSNKEQDIEWYIKDSSEAVIWLIFLAVWWYREIGRNKFWGWLIGLFFVFRLGDLIAYWINHRHVGIIYFFCYLSIIIYAAGYVIKHKIKRY